LPNTTGSRPSQRLSAFAALARSFDTARHGQAYEAPHAKAGRLPLDASDRRDRDSLLALPSRHPTEDLGVDDWLAFAIGGEPSSRTAASRAMRAIFAWAVGSCPHWVTGQRTPDRQARPLLDGRLSSFECSAIDPPPESPAPDGPTELKPDTRTLSDRQPRPLLANTGPGQPDPMPVPLPLWQTRLPWLPLLTVYTTSLPWLPLLPLPWSP
jgi:hypothetical protein